MSIQMTVCNSCQFTDLRKDGTPCPHCEDGVMVVGDGQAEATVHFDGGARPNPGPAAIGCTVETEECYSEYSNTIGEATNNQAEYRALIRALKIAEDAGFDSVTAKGDSQLIVNQVTGEWDTNDDTLEDLRDDVRELAQIFHRFNIEHVPREENETADSLVDGAFEEEE
jgi:ribonuclease HI